MIQKAYKFRLYPNKTQKGLLLKTFGCVRFAWNQWVENFNKPKTELKIFQTPKQFKSELLWMKDISSAAIQQKEIDFKEFKNQFFNKKRKKIVGRPHFKSRKQEQSYRLPNQKFRIEGHKIRLEKIGFVKFVSDREIPVGSKFINVTIRKDLVGDFFISVLVEQIQSELPKTGKSVGIDVGIKSFAVLSTGQDVSNPSFFRENQSELARIQKHLSRKKPGSNRFYQNKVGVSKLYRKIRRKRLFFLHNLSSDIVRNHDWIAVEDLNVAGMVKNNHLAKSISDSSWAEFFRQLEYKCKWHGKELHKVGRFYPSSKTCNVCGFYYQNLQLSEREWICPCCSSLVNRDYNSAKNILEESVRVGAELQTGRECKTLETANSKAVPVELSRVE